MPPFVAPTQNPAQKPPRLPPMLAQPTPNMNNIHVRPSYNNEMANYQPYSLNEIECNDINLRLGKVLQNPPPPLITEHHDSSTPRKAIKIHEGEQIAEEKDQQEAPLLIPPYPQRMESK